MRGTPYPVFSKPSKVINSKDFKSINSHEAIERINLVGGRKIQIRHWGCEYYVITFSFESPELLAKSTSHSAALVEALRCLRELIELKADSIFNLALAASALEQAIKTNPSLAFEEEIPVPGDGTDFLQTRVRIDSATRKGKVGNLVITLLKGPL